MSIRWQPWCLMLVPLCVYGQADLATITGTVTDPSKVAVAGVEITITNTGTDIARTVTSNPEGYFTAAELPAGTYVLTAVGKGFETFRETEIALETGQTRQ